MIILAIVIWYALGLLGSHIALTIDNVMTWEKDKGFGLGIALGGPFCLGGAIVFRIWEWFYRPTNTF